LAVWYQVRVARRRVLGAFLQAVESILESVGGFLGSFTGGFVSQLGEDPRGAIAGLLLGGLVTWFAARRLVRRERDEPKPAPAQVPAPAATPARPLVAPVVPPASVAEEQYHHLFDSSPVPTLVCETRRWRILEANAAALVEYGFGRDELLKLSITDLGLEDDAERLVNTLVQLGAASTDAGTWTQRRKDGTTFEAELATFRAQFARQGARIVCVRDVTRRIRMEQALYQDNERYSLAFKATSDALLDWDLKTDTVWCNEFYERQFGGHKGDAPFNIEALLERIHVDDRTRVQQHLLDATKSTDERWRDEFRMMRLDGTTAYVYARGHYTRGEDKRARRLCVLLQDITVRKEAEERTRFLADHDELTGLPNRNLFRQSLNQALQRAERNNKMVSILFFDLDRFKNINDSLGHDAGDEVLRIVAERLNGCIRKIDVAARFGGDEFAVLVEGLTAEDQAGTVARKILDALSKPMLLHGRQYRPAASIGISTYPNDGRDAQSLQKHADIAMYRAKEEGRSTFQFYSEQLNTHSLQRLEFESNLNNALNNREFVLHYQPKLDVATGKVTSMEALVRWVSPQFGFVSPGQFISVAEETGLILPLGRWVAQTACMQNAAWQKGGLPSLRVAINISARQMADKGLVDFIAETVRKTGLEPSSLELEITESAVMSNQDYAEKVLNRFKELGFHLTMDDFGTGYSSLAYLKRFPFDSVKIDQSFVRGIPANSDDVAIVEAIIAMAHSLQLKVVAEGVETEEQLALLRKLGCDTIQGYYFSKPIPSNEVVMLLFKTLRGTRVASGDSADIESTQRMAVPAELHAAGPAGPEAGKAQKVALAAAEPAKPAAEAGPAPKPAEGLEFKIELPAEFNAPPPDAPKAKEA
jgi:diguanylate cyclase (GGDEF)-like protein/PAS domain S-box-containing protein